ncbi:MAG: hypothetical protein QGI09_11915 [Dehalococcoidia bacterium]|nr:hypothetical protein [Dehalococcoidia bacterium]
MRGFKWLIGVIGIVLACALGAYAVSAGWIPEFGVQEDVSRYTADQVLSVAKDYPGCGSSGESGTTANAEGEIVGVRGDLHETGGGQGTDGMVAKGVQ